MSRLFPMHFFPIGTLEVGEVQISVFCETCFFCRFGRLGVFFGLFLLFINFSLMLIVVEWTVYGALLSNVEIFDSKIKFYQRAMNFL